MEELIRYFRTQGGQGEQLGRWEVILALLLCAALQVVICRVYRFTHKSSSYSQSYVQTLLMMGLVTTVIMIVIGSNIARAFSLVGALSIIRFRNAVKETRDVGFIFFAMAIAMACGTRFYVLAILATAMIGSIMVVAHLLDFGAGRMVAERLLIVQLPPGRDPDTALEVAMQDLFQTWSLISLESVRQGLYTQVTYSVRPKDGVTGAKILEDISKLNDNLKVSYHHAAHTDDL
jgi:ABC-type cobalamin transport system permease subunit